MGKVKERMLEWEESCDVYGGFTDDDYKEPDSFKYGSDTLTEAAYAEFMTDVNEWINSDDNFGDGGESDKVSELESQVGGGHYKELTIQPVEFITKNNLGYLEGNVIKYTTRHHLKNGVEDIDKAIHYLKLIKELEYGE